MLFAVPLESIRLFFVWREVTKLARQKGVSEDRWATMALGMWLGIVGGLSTLSYVFLRHMWLIVFFISIVFSSILYRYLIKRPLLNMTDYSLEEKIDNIGKKDIE